MIPMLSRLLAIKLVRDRFRAKKGQPPRAARPTHSVPRGATYDERPIPPQRGDEPGPDTPLDLAAPDWKETAKRTLKEMKSDRITLVAAGMGYYLFLAIFPALIAFMGILGLAEIDTNDLVTEIESNFPGESGTLLVEAIEGSKTTSDETALGAVLIGIALALWSASSGFVSLQQGLNVAYDVPSDRKFFAARGVALLLVVATGLLGGVPSPFFVFGDGALFTTIGWVLTVAAVTVLFSLYYYFGPNRPKPTWQWVSAGGVIGTVTWIAGSLAFRLYAGTPDRYAETYGSVAAVIALIFWLFLTSLSILIGGELNAELERQAEKRKERSGS